MPNPRICALAAALLASAVSLLTAAPFIIEDGKPRAEIILTENAPRKTQLAAQELQIYLEKITGAKLPIQPDPSGEDTVAIYVGRHEFTDDQSIEVDDLDHEAFRILSGKNWLALIGRDTDFTPVEPWARSHGHWEREKLAEWDELTGAMWTNPFAASLYRYYSGNAFDFGKPKDEKQHQDGEIHFWRYDEGGSLNAVYAWLRDLGVRWYMPGELGEIVPQLSSIELPEIDRTVHPDFEVRTVSFARYNSRNRDDIMYALRLGENRVPSLLAHGMRYISERQDQRDAHPEFMVLVNGKRDIKSKTANTCLSSEGLLKENVRFVQTIFDLYDAPAVSVMPHDGFTQICQCEDCQGKATRDRGYSGWYSDYVWDYVNRVAKEVGKTHPDKKIMCGAYSTYQLPPLKIDKLEPNVLVQITNGRPRWEMDDAKHVELEALRQEWLSKTPNKLSLTMNYPFTQRGEFRPCYFPHVIARGMHDVKDQVWRQDLWLPEKGGLYQPGVNHLNAWIHSRFWWDADQDVDLLLAEYYENYYGPAAAEMKAFIEFCEAHYAQLAKSKEATNQALLLFAAAKQKVDPASAYGQRIALVDDYLSELRKRSEQLNQDREDVPGFWTYQMDSDKWKEARQNFKIDGKLEEPFWVMRGKLGQLQTGEKPEYPTRFQILQDEAALYIGIRCSDMAGAPVNIGSTESGDPAIWSGDHIEILLETETHAYYQIVINPAGAMLNLDRAADKKHWFSWDSQAEVGAHVGEDFWSLEIRIPYTEDDADPLHLVVGRRPTANLPWYFNICRKRIRDDAVEVSAFAPVGDSGKGFHTPKKFAKLYKR